MICKPPPVDRAVVWYDWCMIRTRDFILYLTVLGFVLLGATYTGFSERAASTAAVIMLPEVAEAPTVSAFAYERPNTLAQRWQELRQRLAGGEGYRRDAPAVFTSVDQTAAQEAAEATSSAGFSGVRSVQWCGAPVPAAMVASWPAGGTLRVVEGQRTLVVETTEEINNGSTTEMVLTEEIALALPIRTVRSTFDSCVPDTLVGVTTAGQPLLNDAASTYQNFLETQVVGYTRDGFAVYGPVADAAQLDACGGRYSLNGQYQYHVRTNEPFILGCYAGVPINIDI